MVIGTDCTENCVWNGANKTWIVWLLSAVFLIDIEKERTLLAMLKTLTAQSSSTEVIVCHREVKSAIIKASKELKEMLWKFIKETSFITMLDF